jgi:ornithine carbamoyltransferase
MNHFLDIASVDSAGLRSILDRAKHLKQQRKEGIAHPLLAGKTLAMIFEKNSTRTRVSFEVGIVELGGHALHLSGRDMQIGRGESIADTARVLSRYVDCIMLRCHSHAMLEELAQHASVPVINGLTDLSHPCQIMADILTFEEQRGPIAGRKVAWIGDGNNVCNSFLSAAARFGFTLAIACPDALQPDAHTLEWARSHGGQITVTSKPEEAAHGAHLVVTDTWVSMGSEATDASAALMPYQVNDALMALAQTDALFMHCLPAHRGEEVTASVIDGPQSAVWDEAENRLHVQKAIMLWCMGR